ncbi:substrate-binding periplasmic protein [Desulfosediminicola flagellatus]|uniref:substrate-binding periplasmic protein n=1 Tax=Desulfosediminicola flagellatus TaxID=2569541 RepID=UPI0010AD9F97|nr:transporter substrate-binding domain-containing protein [Desulfosediminicola flagellatus]
MRHFILMISFFVTLFFVNIAQAETCTFLTHFIKPFTFQEEGNIKGLAVDIVKEMMDIMEHPKQFTMLPFKRALLTVQSSDNHALFIVARRPEREETVKWVGPLVSSSVYFYKKKGTNLDLKTLSDIKELWRVGVGRGNADHTYLEAQGFTNLQKTNNQVQSLQMLQLGRVDVTPMSELVMPEMAKHAGIDLDSIERTAVKLYDSILFLAFSIDTPDDVVDGWQRALDTVKISGKYQDIYDRYIQ